MYHIAYDKDTLHILGFIGTEDEINPDEVFANFDNYEYKKTTIQPPFSDYNNYVVQLENDEIVGYERSEQYES